MTKPLLTDERIDQLLRVDKRLTGAEVAKLRGRGRGKQNRAFSEVQVDIVTSDSRFRIYAQRHDSNALQFAIQLVYIDDDGNEYRLVRLAGRTGPHTNELERLARTRPWEVTDRFRINRLTERYQASDYEEDGFAISASNRFTDFDAALEALRELAGFTWPTAQRKLL